MRLLVWALSAYMIVMGTLLISAPVWGKRMADWLLRDKTHRGFALITLAIGVGLFFAASEARWPVFIAALGALTAIKGCYLLVAPREQLRGVVERWEALPVAWRRGWGVAGLAAGVLMAIAA